MEQRERFSSTLIAIANDVNPSISFIPDGTIDPGSCSNIIRSIINIGEEIGVPFDILVPAIKGSKNIGISVESYDERIFIYPMKERENALGFLTELSDSKYICLFSSKLPTEPDMADVISRYIRSGEVRFLVSDVSVIMRSEIIRAGGFHNLGKYSIVDLFGRLSAVRGVITCTTGRRSLSFFSPISGESLFSSDIGASSPPGIDDYIKMKVSANLGSGDLISLVKNSQFSRRIANYLMVLLSAFVRKSKVNLRIGKVGYVRFMESLVESIIFEDFRDFMPEHEILMRIGRPEIALLRKNSSMWRNPIDAIKRFVVVDSVERDEANTNKR